MVVVQRLLRLFVDLQIAFQKKKTESQSFTTSIFVFAMSTLEHDKRRVDDWLIDIREPHKTFDVNYTYKKEALL